MVLLGAAVLVSAVQRNAESLAAAAAPVRIVALRDRVLRADGLVGP